MTDRQIIFSAPMIRALLDGSKSQTRRVLKPQPEPDFLNATIAADNLTFTPAYLVGGPTHKMLRRIARPGDRLWVREAVRAVDDQDTYDFQIEYLADQECRKVADHDDRTSDAYGDWWNLLAYRSDDPDLTGGKTVPPIHMPRWASRLTLMVEAVKVERLQDISEEDAIAEGIETWRAGWADKEAAEAFLRGTEARMATKDGGTAQRLFYLLWWSIHGFGAWEANPWVCALTFRVIKQNIDALTGGRDDAD